MIFCGFVFLLPRLLLYRQVNYHWTNIYKSFIIIIIFLEVHYIMLS